MNKPKTVDEVISMFQRGELEIVGFAYNNEKLINEKPIYVTKNHITEVEVTYEQVKGMKDE